jgi:hypothetical protein
MAPEQEKAKKEEIIVVKPKPVVEKKEVDSKRINNIKIGKIGNLTFNVMTRPLKHRYEKYYKSSKLHLIVDLVLALIVVMLLGSLVNLWLFSRARLVNLMDFKVTSSPEVLINGQTTEFTISYSNTTKDTLADVVLVLKLPPSLRKPEFDSKNFDLKTHSLKIGDLKAHASGELRVSGLLLDNFGAKQEFLAVINYKNKYGQSRQEFFSQDFQLTQSVIETKMNLPEKIIATTPFKGNIYIKNNSSLNLKDLKIKMVAPEGFNLIETELGNVNNQIWPIGTLTSGQEKSFRFSAKLYVNKPQNISLQDEVYATYEDTEYLIVKSEASAPVEFSKFILDFSNPEKNQFVNPGDKITYIIHYKNAGDFALKNVQLSLESTGDYVDKTSITGNYETIDLLEPGQEGTLNLVIATRPTISFSEYNETGYAIETRIIAFYDDPLNKIRTSVESLPLITKLSSRLSLTTTALFFTPEGDQIGVGSVPPKVGEYTSYWAVIKVINTNNKVRGAKIIAQIPGGVEFTNIYNVTAGDQIIYHKNSNQIEWQIEEIPVLAGIYNPAPEARIQIAITPLSDQVGTSPLLLSGISATATDEVTGALLTASGKNISTIISLDESLNKVIE